MILVSKPTSSQIDWFKQALRFVNEQFLDKEILQRIMDKRIPNYKIWHLEDLWLISIIKKNEIYLNHLYRKNYVSPEALAGIYCRWDHRMIWWLGVYNKYGYTTQIAQRTIVYNTKIVGKKIIAGQRFIFYKKAPSFFRWRERKEAQWIKYYIMTPERALIQMIIEYKGVLEFEEDIAYKIQIGEVNKDVLLKMSQKYCTRNNQQLLEKYMNILWNDSNSL